MIYLDNAATTFPKPDEVYLAVLDAMKTAGANPGRGGYTMAIEASKLVYQTREKIARFLNAQKSEEIVFTSNATEALNLAIKGILKPGDHVITTSMEHNSVYRPLKYLEDQGLKLTIVKASATGEINVQDIKQAIHKDTKLIIVMHASNVSGTIMPVSEIGRLAKEKNVTFAVDAAQSVGYLPVDVQEMNVDLLAFPGHKGLYGPPGTGGLYVRSGVELITLKEGGTGISSHDTGMPKEVPERYEAGTLNVPGIAGLGAGIDYLNRLGLDNIIAKMNTLSEELIYSLKEIKGLKIHGLQHTHRVPVFSFTIENLDPAEIAILLDKQYDIAVRAGLHCSPLAHMSLGTIETGTVRVSLGTFNSKEDIIKLKQALIEITEM